MGSSPDVSEMLRLPSPPQWRLETPANGLCAQRTEYSCKWMFSLNPGCAEARRGGAGCVVCAGRLCDRTREGGLREEGAGGGVCVWPEGTDAGLGGAAQANVPRGEVCPESAGTTAAEGAVCLGGPARVGPPGWARGVRRAGGGRGQRAGPATSLGACVLGRAERRAGATAAAAARAGALGRGVPAPRARRAATGPQGGGGGGGAGTAGDLGWTELAGNVGRGLAARSLRGAGGRRPWRFGTRGPRGAGEAPCGRGRAKTLRVPPPSLRPRGAQRRVSSGSPFSGGARWAAAAGRRGAPRPDGLAGTWASGLPAPAPP